MALLEIKNVSYNDGLTQVIKDTSLSLEKGSITAFLGESGGGKSTVLKLLSGIIPPANGKVSAIAVEADGFTFDHWERNGVSVGINKVLDVDVAPLAEGETEAIYKAVFTEV